MDAPIAPPDVRVVDYEYMLRSQAGFKEYALAVPCPKQVETQVNIGE